ALERLRQERDALLTEATAGWAPGELADFTGQLRRFVQDLTDHLPTLASVAGGAVDLPEKDR
ncbi:MarR family transcriptional regulator, partial [Modestobacter sp. VKM Ac-2676]